jgi:hypothetical protein
MVINIPATLKVEEIGLSQLPEHWWEISHYPSCRKNWRSLAGSGENSGA